ncbi:uncharacterized protein CG13380 [Drosophila innubila]|uniref:uncharacterized protein CG13380 n=1 Tax=Drosophila innubila TaxID=198719 RepID=UPI00148D84BF|nr:uncharacterized protein CG13380 [Drosophila innubila]XP_034482270.1 uncharacterized protein CG13380 [Drosophila innubila]
MEEKQTLTMASANFSAKKETENDNYKEADQNNNIDNNDSNNNKEIQKLKYELPSDYKYEVHKCVCHRPQKVFECGRCHHYFHGRISVHCQVHPRDCFLMDFCSCPYCFTSTTNVMESSLSWDQVRKIEDAQLPDSDEF